MFLFRASSSGNAPKTKRYAAFWTSRRRASFLSLAGGAFGAAWILLHSPRMAQVLAPATIPTPEPSSKRQQSESGFGGMGRRDAGVARQSLYVANLACQTGEYIVSIRRVHSPSYIFSSNPPYSPTARAAELLRLSLQVMSTRTGRIQRVDNLHTNLEVTDSTGKRLTLLEPAYEFTFPEGAGCVCTLSAPANEATHLRSIDGVIRFKPEAEAKTGSVNPSTAAFAGTPVSASGNPTDLPFHITNVPLPWKLRVFGMAGAAIVQGNLVRALPLASKRDTPNSLPVLKGEPLEAVLSHLPPSAFSSSAQPPQPNLLALPQDLPSVVPLRAPLVASNALPPNPRVPTLPLTCTLTPHIDANGNMQVGIRVKGTNPTPGTLMVPVRDNEPLLLAVPAAGFFPGQPSDARVVLYLDLHLDYYPPESMYDGPLPRDFLVQKGEIGGALSGQITTSKGAFGLAVAKLIITRRQAAGTMDSKQRRLLVALDKRGRFALSNWGAGQYHIELAEVQPYQSSALPKSAFEEFLLQRLGLRQARIDRKAQEVTVKAGSRVELPPWIFHETK